MAKVFTFRLERLLEIRRLKEEMARRDLARGARQLREHNQRVLAILREQEEAKREMKDMKTRSVKVSRLRLQEGYLEVLERRLRRAVERLQELAMAEQDAREALTETSRRVRVLERLRDRREAAFKSERERKERAILDEIAAFAYRKAS